MMGEIEIGAAPLATERVFEAEKLRTVNRYKLGIVGMAFEPLIALFFHFYFGEVLATMMANLNDHRVVVKQNCLGGNGFCKETAVE